MSSSVLKQIAALGELSAAELKERWRDLMGTEPPRYTVAPWPACLCPLVRGS